MIRFSKIFLASNKRKPRASGDDPADKALKASAEA